MVKDKVVFTSYINQEVLLPFNDVLFMQALFEETILYRLWDSQGVKFSEHGYFEDKLNSVHSSKGGLVSVGHLLHEDDNTSKNRFQKNYETGEQLGNPRDGTVIHELIRQADNYLENGYLLSFNNWVRCRKMLHYPNGEKIPAVANGLDDYKDSHKIACLMSNNPEPILTGWIEKRTGMAGVEINNTYRIHSIYQSIGRTSIRDMDNTDPKVFIVASEKDARYLHELFKDSKWLGQVGYMNRVPTPPRTRMVNTVQSNDEYQSMVKQKKVLQRKLSRWEEQGNDYSDIQDEITMLAGKMVILKSEIKSE